jgi:drug/metabolite transporter (DMT)-like permease
LTAAGAAAPRMQAIDAAAVAIMIGLTFSWGLNGVAAKLANAGYSPVLLTLLRSLIGAACVFLWCRWRGVPLFECDGTLLAGFAAGILFGGEFVLIYMGLDFTTVARSALMVNTMPFWVLLGAHFLLGERMSAQKLVGLVLAFGGVVLVFSDRLSLPDSDAIKGDLMSLAAGAFWAATILVIKGTRLAKASAEKVLLYQLAVSAVATLPLLPFAGPLVREPSALAVGALLFQAIFVVGFTYVVWFGIMRRYPAAGLSSFTFLTPAFGVLLGGTLLGEPLSIQIFLALGLIAAGLVLVNRVPKSQAS